MAHAFRNAVALVAGIGAYRQRGRIPTLRYAARDARGLARMLVDPDVCAFSPEQVCVLTNRQANRGELVRRLSGWLPAQAKNADLVLIYFAGHGVAHRIGGREEGFLLPYDADADNPVVNGIPMGDLSGWIADIQARSVVVCLDCCHAGFLPQEAISMRGELDAAAVLRTLKPVNSGDRDLQIQPSLIDQLSGSGRFLIASCSKGQKSIEAEEFRHGLFTYHLLRGLEGEGDRDGDGKVSVAELFAYVSGAVSKDAKRFNMEQTPWTSATYAEEVLLSTVRPPVPEPGVGGQSTKDGPAPVTARVADDEDADLIARLRELRKRPNPTELPFIFRHLAHQREAVRDRAKHALRAITWEHVADHTEELARHPKSEPLNDVLDGLAALEAHRDVVSLLDLLAGVLRGPLRDRAVWLLERKRLALERERLGEIFREERSSYTILKVLGPGLYTGAYLAEQRHSELKVVVRVLRPEYAGQPLVRSHFLDLSRRAVRLVHQNLALTREVGAFPDSGLYFAVRDFIDGPTLREVLASGRRFDPPQAIKILRQVIDALTALHRDGLPHAGVKPSNIFLTRNDHVVLGDPSLPLPAVGFDLPRLAYDFRYAPPELFRSRGDFSHMSDLYCIGCVAYELFYGQPPFVSDSPFELISRHDRDALSWSSNVADRWLSRLLGKTPAERFADLAEVVAALNEVEEGCRPKPTPDSPSSASAAGATHESAPTLPLGTRRETLERFLAEAENTGSLSHPDIVKYCGPDTPDVGSVHLMGDQSLMQFDGRESLVPLTHGGPPPTMHPSDGDSAEIVSHVPLQEGHIPGYEILGVLGRGGMGVVYKARQIRLNRIVAIKVILSGQHAGSEEMARFRTEAEAVAQLQHPNIMQVFDLGEHGGLPFLVMEYCGGGSLAQQLERRPQFPTDSAKLCQTLALAVQAAHQQNILHRDLKPGNVLFTEDGIPKITDFGLAKRLDIEVHTITGAVLGTPAYMAPELAEGKSASSGPGVDIYSLGAMLYEMLTGRPPFAGPNPFQMLQRVVSEPPTPPRQLVPGVPRDLEIITLKCLEKDPARRYASAADLADDLHRFLEGEPIRARARGWRGWWPFGK